jgi:hypothetical protein
MVTSDRVGALLGLPGMLLALAIFGYLFFAKTVCEPLYQPNALLDPNVLANVNPGVAAKLGGTFTPPPREGLAFHREPYAPVFCSSPR